MKKKFRRGRRLIRKKKPVILMTMLIISLVAVSVLGGYLVYNITINLDSTRTSGEPLALRINK